MAQQTVTQARTSGDSGSRAKGPRQRAPKRGGGTITAAELEGRLDFVEDKMLLLLDDRKAAREAINEYRVHLNTALKYCRWVRERRWEPEAKARGGADRETKREIHIRRIAKIMKDASEKGGSQKVRLQAAVYLAQLDGYLIRVEHSGPNGGPIPLENLPDAELDARLRELEAKDGGKQS